MCESKRKNQGDSSPAAPSTPPYSGAAGAGRNRPSSAPSCKKPWVVADWKHRVSLKPCSRHRSDGGGAVAAAAAAKLHTAQRAAFAVERRRQLTAEFSVAHDTINRMLARCKHVQQHLHLAHNSSSSSSKSSAGNSYSGPCVPISTPRQQALHLTMRSKLLFEAATPSAVSSSSPTGSIAGHTAASASAASPPHVTHTTAPAVAAATPASAATSAEGDLCRDGSHQQQGVTVGQHGAWDGAVDLNPGFSFIPGTPERAAAVLRHTGQQSIMTAQQLQLPATAATAAGTTGARNAICPTGGAVQAAPCFQAACPGVNSLTHRERMQGGLQQLTANFYRSMKQQQQQQ